MPSVHDIFEKEDGIVTVFLEDIATVNYGNEIRRGVVTRNGSQEVVSGIRAVASFGHSLGHMSYLVESEGKSCLIWGDVTNHYIFSLQRPDLVPLSEAAFGRSDPWTILDEYAEPG